MSGADTLDSVGPLAGLITCQDPPGCSLAGSALAPVRKLLPALAAQSFIPTSGQAIDLRFFGWVACNGRLAFYRTVPHNAAFASREPVLQE